MNISVGGVFEVSCWSRGKSRDTVVEAAMIVLEIVIIHGIVVL